LLGCVRLLHTGEKEGGALELVLQKLLVRFERANPFALGGQLRLQHFVLHDELLVRVRFFLPFVERLPCSGRKDAEELSGIDAVTAVRIFVCADGAIFHILPDGALAFSGLLRSLTYGKFHRVFLVFAFVRISVHSSYCRERLGHVHCRGENCKIQASITRHVFGRAIGISSCTTHTA
jgi:hypothetical protein